MPERPDRDQPPQDGGRDRQVLTKKWAYLLLSRVFLPLSQADLERELLVLFDAVHDAVRSEPFTTHDAYEAGVRLVELGCSADELLSSTVDVLGKGLLSLPEFQPVERFAERIVLGIGALACGITAASRRSIFDQQERMNLALLKAVRDAKWNLEQSEARFDEVAMSSASGIMITDVDGKLVRVNGAVADMLGYSAAELTGVVLFDIVHPDYAPVLREDYRALLDGTTSRLRQSQLLLCRNGDVARISLTASLLRGADDRPSQFVTVVEDGTELLLLQGELNRQALHDALTGLPNRQFFSTHIEAALHRVDQAHGVTLFHLDLDAFAMICNGLGRRVGERLLIEVGRRLKSVVADETAMVAGFGGDEFGILVENSATTPTVATLVANINAALGEPIHGAGQGVAVSACIGVVHRPPEYMDAAELLRAADLTLRRVKANGRGQWGMFHAGQDERDRATYTLAAAMPGAWELGEISVVYRPVARLADGRIDGVEALLRWGRPVGLDPLPHDRCVELADMSGLILPLGDWLRRGARRDARWWQQRFPGRPTLTVGLTAHQASDADLVSRVVGALDSTGLPPDRLTLWLPVQALPAPEVTDNLRGLADVGVRMGLDDFGTAAAELAAVEDLPVRSVRLARALVERVDDDGGSPLHSALRAVSPLVHAEGATVVVNGVHTPAQADWWRAAGADLAVGDHFGTPRPADEMATVLATM